MMTVPNVMTEYKAVHGFVHTDPFDSPFWDPNHATRTEMDVSAWNYYGSMFTPSAYSAPPFSASRGDGLKGGASDLQMLTSRLD